MIYLHTQQLLAQTPTSGHAREGWMFHSPGQTKTLTPTTVINSILTRPSGPRAWKGGLGGQTQNQILPLHPLAV